MNDSERFECRHCGKVIEFERPLFCPFCGKQIDPTEGLIDEDADVDLYPSSRVAPLATNLLVAWGVLVIPVTFFFGRSGFAWAAIFLAAAEGALFLGTWLRSTQRGDRR